jgi:hypothetical protein
MVIEELLGDPKLGSLPLLKLTDPLWIGWLANGLQGLPQLFISLRAIEDVIAHDYDEWIVLIDTSVGRFARTSAFLSLAFCLTSSASIFNSGKLVITGGKSPEECEEGARIVRMQLENMGLI